MGESAFLFREIKKEMIVCTAWRERERKCCLGVVFHERSDEGTMIGLCMVK